MLKKFKMIKTENKINWNDLLFKIIYNQDEVRQNHIWTCLEPILKF